MRSQKTEGSTNHLSMLKVALVTLTLLSTTCVPFLEAQRRGRKSPAQDRFANLGFKVGTAFPDITLPDLDRGQASSLAKYRGKKLIVLHFASW